MIVIKAIVVLLLSTAFMELKNGVLGSWFFITVKGVRMNFGFLIW